MQPRTSIQPPGHRRPLLAMLCVAACAAALGAPPARAADPSAGGADAVGTPPAAGAAGTPGRQQPAADGGGEPAGQPAAAPKAKAKGKGKDHGKHPGEQGGQDQDGKAARSAAPGDAEKLQVYDEIKVTGRGSDMVGIADSATEGVVGHQELERRPMLRPGEVLETVPGLMISQHSGAGKANQYYLRGFNLDHGTDFSITVDSIPINQPSNGHGQGYSDLNFVIPELIESVRYQKGLYYADKGDFSAAGAAEVIFLNSLGRPLVEATGGSYGYRRGLAADSVPVAGGDLLGAIEYMHNDGPWLRPDDYRKKNGLLRYNRGDQANGFTVTLQGYDGTWNATDQIPQRAVRDGLISRFGSVDPTDGGSSYRYSLASELRRGGDNWLTTLSGFVYSTRLRLFSDFTYFLEDPVNGDQFEQFDHRTVEGVKLQHQRALVLFGREIEAVAGVQMRNDNIHNGIIHTRDRLELSVTRQDYIQESALGPYAQLRVRWAKWLRMIAGLRADYYRFNVDSNLRQNSGFRNRAIAEPKVSFLLGPWRGSEFYLNLGEGFHSNDARGTTITVDPRTRQPILPVSPLVRAKSADVGFRTSLIPNLQTSISFFRLDLASELIFNGDAGDTSASRPSRRTGFELQNFYRPAAWLVVDADFSLSHAHFTNFDPVGDHIPGAIARAAAVGLTITDVRGFFGSLRWRYFGPRPLIEDSSVSSHSTSLYYLDLGYNFPHNVRLTLEVFNLFNAKVSDIDYYYTSRLPGEPAAGVNDIHFHPSESRALRLAASYRF
jgi:TonB dependent receptor/TonB-dependent Receptor Plug Domain